MRPRSRPASAPVPVTEAVEPVNVADLFARLGAMIAAQRTARVQEAANVLRAELERVQEGVRKNNEEWHRLRSGAGAAVTAVATARERLLLARLDTKSHHAFTRGMSALRAGRDSDAQKCFRDYDAAQNDAHWIWGVMIDRAKGADNRSRTDNFLLPGEIQTVVQAVDAQGKPMKLSKYGVMP